MRVIIAGSRTITDSAMIAHAVKKSGFEMTENMSGNCRGADQLGERYAHAHNIPTKQFCADWSQYGRAAGPIRNRLMAEYADALIALWDGKSRGTKNMIAEMKRLNKPIYIHNFLKERTN